MEQYTLELYNNMLEELRQVEISSENKIILIQQSIEVIYDTLDRLKTFMTTYEFVNIEEEITYFKTIAPQFHAKLIYYAWLYQIEVRLPVGGKKVCEKYYNHELNRIYHFFRENEYLYHYYRSNSVIQDSELFTRASRSLKLTVEEYSSILDNRICTAAGFKMAKIMAYEELQDQLTGRLELLETSVNQKVSKYNCRWTGPKAALTELVYALIYGGMINNGQVEVKELATCLENVFQINMGNYYRVKQEIYSRKNPTAFLDLLKKRLREGLDESDEKYRRH